MRTPFLYLRKAGRIVNDVTWSIVISVAKNELSDESLEGQKFNNIGLYIQAKLIL